MGFLDRAKELKDQAKALSEQATDAFKAAQEDGTIDALKANGKAKLAEVTDAVKKNLGPKQQ